MYFQKSVSLTHQHNTNLATEDRGEDNKLDPPSAPEDTRDVDFIH